VVGETHRTALTMLLRPATPNDLPILLGWDEQPHVVAASGEDGGFDWEHELPRLFDWRELLIAEHDGRPIGIVQIIDPALEETHYWGDCEPDLRAIDLWIGEEADLGKGYGSEIMRLVIARCFADPRVTAIIIDPLVSNTRAHRFYERFGFGIVDRRVFADIDDCYVMRLARSVEERT
jgi:aminoglycoside 6'-N-acetyltransferase